MAFRTVEQTLQVRRRRINRLRLNLCGRIAVSVFVICHVFAVAIYNMPNDNDLVPPILKYVQPYIVATNFLQGWGMFAPDPYSKDVYVVATAQYQDGSVHTWTFPREATMTSMWLRYNRERWRKYIEVAEQDKYSGIWPTMAKYAARKLNVYPNNPPVYVSLTRWQRYVRGPMSANDAPFTSFEFYGIDVTPEDLR